jgi:hypothetical protein
MPRLGVPSTIDLVAVDDTQHFDCSSLEAPTLAAVYDEPVPLTRSAVIRKTFDLTALSRVSIS